jgi:lipopolysaccharide transport system ATP-binding protein
MVIRWFNRNGEANGRRPAPVPSEGGHRREAFWAVRDVSFSIEHGEAVGIIGQNGAGKSTVLKLISRIIEPTSGHIEVNGRIGALLELGAGFHPDLSGRENIYLNGSILGLRRAAIDRKLDQIIAFTELERFIDMPVRHYSSGMRMRLGFSVAAHIDPDILLIDEVLAVGDENFQHKCLDRILELRRRGVTICFVSHGLGSVRRLCSRAIWLDEGFVQARGAVDDVVSAYLRHAADAEERRSRGRPARVRQIPRQDERKGDQTDDSIGDRDLRIEDVAIVDSDGAARHVFHVGEPWAVRLHYRSAGGIQSPVFKLMVHRNDLCVSDASAALADVAGPFTEGDGSILYTVGQLPLMEGTYELSVSAHDQDDPLTFDRRDRAHVFKVRQVGSGERYGLVSLGGRWAWSDEAKVSQEAAPSPGRSGNAAVSDEPNADAARRWGLGSIQVLDVSFLDATGVQRRVFETGEPWTVRLRYRATQRIEEPVFGLAVHRSDGLHICGPNTHFEGLDIPFVEGAGEVWYRVEHLPLMEGSYLLSVSAHNRADTEMYDFHDRQHAFTVCHFPPAKSSGVVELGGEWTQEAPGTA